MGEMKRRMERMVEESEHFDMLAMKKMEMEHRYYFKVAGAVIQFCPLGKYTDNMERFMQHMDEKWKPGKVEHCDMADMTTISANRNPQDVAQDIANLPKKEQVEMFFGGMKDSVCGGLMTYLQQLEAWTVQFPRFEDMLSMM